ncbi:MAG: RHS repeat-associated core domain-containing protein [Candidatus Omnitrophota bacterium]
MRVLKKFRLLIQLIMCVLTFSVLAPMYALAGHSSLWYIEGTPLDDTTPAAGSGNPKAPDGPPFEGCEGESPNKTPKKADPVYLHSGEFYYPCTDLVIPGRGMDVVINHLYRSGKPFNGPFGFGWTMSYYYRIRPLSNGNVVLISGNGRTDEFMNSGGIFTAPAGFFANLVQNGNGSWTLTRLNGTKYEFDVDGKITAILDRNNNQITFSYDATLDPIYSYPLFPLNPPVTTPEIVGYDYRLTTITDTVGREIDFTYNADGKLDKITDFAGREVSFTYDDDTGDLLSITKPATAQYSSGLTKTFTYDANHKMTTVTDAKGQTFVTNYYDSEGRIESQALGLSGTFGFSYGANSTTLTDRKGFVTTYTFDSNANVTSIEQFTDGVRGGDPASFVTTYTYNSNSMLTSITYPEGNGVKYVYDDANSNVRSRSNLLQIRKKANMAAADSSTNDIITNMTYETNFNQIKTTTDPKGNVYTYTYDYELSPSDPKYATKGNVVKLEQPTVNSQVPTTHFTYNAYGQVIEVQDPNGNITEYDYFTATGYLKEIIQDPSGINAVTAYTYDTFGNIDTKMDANNHAMNYDYNELNWLIKITNALGYETKYTYDQNGNVTKLERQANTGATVWQTVEYTYDILNNVETVKDPLNHVTTYNYDDSENLESVADAETNTTTYEYDERDMLFKHKDANTPQGVTQYDYDGNGNLAKITDAEGNETTYGYDGFDRRTSMTYDDASASTYEYDKNSNLTKHITPSGNDIDYTYDALNRRLTKEFESDSSLDITYTYDVGSRMTAADNDASEIDYVYDDLNRVTSTTQTVNSNAYTLAFEYDDVGNRTEVSYPGGKVVNYVYDDINRMTDINVNSSGLVDYTYDTLDRRATKSFISTNLPKATYTYDIANQLTELNNDVLPSTSVSQFDYTYDNVGNREDMVVTGTLVTTGTFTYAYNDIYELTGVSGADSHSYAYDNVGNRTTVDSVNYTPNTLNQYTQVGSTNFTYDGNDNLSDDGTNDYTYDESNRLLTVDNTSHNATYEYDAFNRRVSKTVDSVTTYYVYDGNEVVEEYNSSDVLHADYVMGSRIDERLTMTRSSTDYFYHMDGLGTVRQLTNGNGVIQESYDYDPYGNTTIYNSSGSPVSASVIGNRFIFTGREYDEESSIYYYRRRYYAPVIGRFLQRDSLEYFDSMNLFQYVDNNPVNYVDPLGTSSKGSHKNSKVKKCDKEDRAACEEECLSKGGVEKCQSNYKKSWFGLDLEANESNWYWKKVEKSCLCKDDKKFCSGPGLRPIPITKDPEGDWDETNNLVPSLSAPTIDINPEVLPEVSPTSIPIVPSPTIMPSTPIPIIVYSYKVTVVFHSETITN